jgi:hypothetical protein
MPLNGKSHIFETTGIFVKFCNCFDCFKFVYIEFPFLANKTRIRNRIRIQIWAKNLWIRIQEPKKPKDPAAPEHWYHRWASLPQTVTVTSLPLLTKWQIVTVTSFSLLTLSKNWNGYIVTVTCLFKKCNGSIVLYKLKRLHCYRYLSF